MTIVGADLLDKLDVKVLELRRLWSEGVITKQTYTEKVMRLTIEVNEQREKLKREFGQGRNKGND
ncbi:hypothetical protein ACQKFG_05640 [Peribacillus sp. NPDC076916]|uniref:hypothetical protein n=1 Tax=Peribacillus sp. NPDC076916 TaxID=3390608 RepID=UPI003CFFDAC8